MTNNKIFDFTFETFYRCNKYIVAEVSSTGNSVCMASFKYIRVLFNCFQLYIINIYIYNNIYIIM